MKLFFGCSQSDAEIVDALMVYISKSFEIDLSQMFNCYVGKTKPPAGKDFNAYIRQAIINSDRIISLVTVESLKRKYCLCELGAAWGLDKNIISIIVKPCEFADLLSSPLMGMQAWNVDLCDKANIDKFIQNINSDEAFSNLKRNHSNIRQREFEEEFKENLISIGNRNIEIPSLPEYSKCSVFHSNNDPYTLRITQNDVKGVKVKIDFSTSTPDFVGFYFDLKDANWAGLIAKNYSLSFHVESLPTVKSVQIEFKSRVSGEGKIKIGERRIILAQNSKDEVILLSDISENLHEWENMRELTFVFYKTDIQEIGTFMISNLCFIKPDGGI